jgi:hypothetical protein
MLQSNSTAKLTSAHEPHAEICSTGKHDKESLDEKSDVDEVLQRMRVQRGILRTTSVMIRSEMRV